MLSLLIKPAGGLCNMQCRYCFYRDEEEHRAESAKRMTEETLEAVLQKTLPFANGKSVIAFQGGEPTLAGLDFFRKALVLEKKYAHGIVENALQTNALCIDDEWADFLAREKFLVGVSLDGTKDMHDANRTDFAGKGTFLRVLRNIQLLQRHGVMVNVLTVVTNHTSAQSAYNFFMRNNLTYQQYIPCLEPLDCAAQSPLSAEKYGIFLKNLFDCWYRDVMDGKPISIRYFDNLLLRLRGETAEACDMQGYCSMQLTIEADGSAYPCDFYAMDAYRLGNFHEDTLETIRTRCAESDWTERGRTKDEECRACPWLGLCRGGCGRHCTNSSAPDAWGHNRFCNAYREFFAYAYPRLERLAAGISYK